MLQIDAYRHQYGVGQGCFHLQTLEFSGDAGADLTYRFVYDCGGAKFQSKKTLDWCIAHATAGTPPLEVNAVYLSHFEDDHVNGVQELCKKAKVHRIFAPHIDLHSAVHIIAQQLAAGATWTTSYQQFASALFDLAGGDDVFGVPVTRVRGGGPPPEGPALPNDLPRDLENVDQSIDAVAPNRPVVSHSERVTIVASKRMSRRAFHHEVVWEMVHWYYGGDDLLTAQILTEIAKINGYSIDCLPGIEANATSVQVDTALQWMKKNRAQIAAAYLVAMAVHNAVRAVMVPPKPAFPNNHNVASLCLYSGPIASKTYLQNANACGCHRLYKKGGMYWVGAKEGAWIATGDAMLGIADIWNEFIAHFGTIRVDACSTVLIPHHGADAATSHNFTAQLIRANQFCVISAGANNSYKHPHRNVVQAILKKPASLQLVTESDPMGFVEYLAFHAKI